MTSVSVYIPCYNGEKDLKEVIESVLAQTYPIHEVIFVNDGSTDNSLAIASQYPIRIISHPNNRGLAASRNTALRAATGDYLAGIDADTVLAPDWLEILIGTFSKEKDDLIAVAGRLIERYGASIADSWRKRVMAQHHGPLPKENVHLYGCNSLIKTESLRQLGGFNEALERAFDDIDLSQRIVKAGFRTKYIPEALCFHCKQDTQTSISESAYRWRMPPFEQQGIFRDEKLLGAKWITEVRAGLQEIEDLHREGNDFLLFVSFYILFHSVLVDLLEHQERAPSAEHERAIYVGYALLIRAIWQMPSVTELVRSESENRLKRRASKQITSEDFFSAVHKNAKEKQTAESFLKAVSYEPSSKIDAILLTSIGQLPSSLQFRPEICEAIETSLIQVMHDEQVDFYSAVNRVILVAVRTTVENPQYQQKISEIVTSLNAAQTPYRLFYFSEDTYKERELLEEICTVQPTQVIALYSQSESAKMNGFLLHLRSMCPKVHITENLLS